MHRSHALVGRAREVALIAHRMSDARSGRGRVVIIVGEAGSGKTSLMQHSAAGATDLVTYRAFGHEVDRDRPFGVIADALDITTESRDPERAAIARALRASADLGMSDALRYQLVEDAVGVIERAALVRPVLLAIDDLHWADEPSLLTLHHLARRIERLPVCLLMTRRPLPRATAAPLQDLVGSGAELLALAPLEATDVITLASEILGAEPGTGLRAVLAKAGGNPFFVTELLAALGDDRSIAIRDARADVAVVEAPPQLRMVILRRLTALAPATVDALRMAAILGETFAATELAIALASTPSDLVGPISEAVAHDVLRSEGDRLAFRHDLVREALYNDMPVSVRQALHLQVAQTLGAAGVTATRLAPHYVLAATADAEAVGVLRRAAAEIATTDARTAERWLNYALELLGAGDERDAVIVELCQVLLGQGDATAVERLARDALARSQPVQRRVALHRALATALDLTDRCLDASAISAAEAAADDVDQVERVRFAAEAVETRSHVDQAGAQTEAQEVLMQATAIGDNVAQGRVLAALYHAAMWRGDYSAALEFAQRFAVVAGTDPAASAGAMVGRAQAGLGRLSESIETLRGEARAREARRDMRLMTPILTELARSEMAAGQWDEALSDVEAAQGLALEFEHNIRHDEAAVLLARIAIRRGDVDRAASLLGGLRASRRFVATMADAELALARDDVSAALEILRSGWELAKGSGRHSDLAHYAPDLIRLELAAGRSEPARDVARTLGTLAQERGTDPISVAAMRCAGLVDDDADKLAQASAAARRAGLIDIWARAAEDAGAPLARAGRTKEAILAIAEAADYAEGVGAARDLRRLENSLRGLGVRRGRRSPHSRATTGWESLTETERSVVKHAAEGLTNAEIGARLFISGRTVERHLTHIYSKLDVNSRVELARIAATR